MNIVKRNFRGKEISVVYDCPCDNCSKHNFCKKQKMYCSAFSEYVNRGWYDVVKVQKRLKLI